MCRTLKLTQLSFPVLSQYAYAQCTRHQYLVPRITQTQFFSTTFLKHIKANELPPRPKIDEDEIEEVFLKGGGKGGQKINKTNSKVQLKHISTGIVVSSQYSRSREQNRARAREILAVKVQDAQAGAGEKTRASVVAEYKKNKARKKKSKARKKYRQLEAGKQESPDEDTETTTAGPMPGSDNVNTTN